MSHEHRWVTIYDQGYRYELCACGAMRAQREAGRAAAYVALAMFCSVFPAFITWLLVRPYFGQVVADFAALLAFLLAFGIALSGMCLTSAGSCADVKGEVE